MDETVVEAKTLSGPATDNGSYRSMGAWTWTFVLLLIFIVVILLVWWAWPSDCSTCNVVPTQRGSEVTTFHVTVAEKDKTHPHYDRGSTLGYVIDGVQGKSLELKVGEKYRFIVRTQDHPFYIGTKDVGGDGEYPDLIDIMGTPLESGSVPFVPESDMPRLLYYNCGNHQYMGSSIIIKP
jgi:hypothetical protein